MSGRKVFTREVLSSADVNGLLMGQTVMRFPSSAVRGVDLPNPEANMLSMLDTAPGRIDYWHPTAGVGGVGIWLPATAGAVRGKMWRTAGGTAPLGVGVDTLITMQASRVSGGFVFEADGLTLPLDGRYDLDVMTYLTNNATGNVGAWVRRVRSGAANNVTGQHMLFKPYGTIDVQHAIHYNDYAFKAGDRLALTKYAYHAGMGAYGVQEAVGISLTATYVGPLNGATPL